LAIDPFQPLDDVVKSLRELDEKQAKLALGLSVSRAVHNDEPEALVRLAMAFYVWRGLSPTTATKADVVRFLGSADVIPLKRPS